MTVLERSQEDSAADAHLVSAACLKAASEIGLSKEELGAIVGRHRTSMVRSLDALMGSNPELMKHWMEQPLSLSTAVQRLPLHASG